MSDRCGEDFLDELLQLSSGSFDIPEAFGMTAEDDAAAIRGLSFDDGVFDINNASGLFDDDDVKVRYKARGQSLTPGPASAVRLSPLPPSTTIYQHLLVFYGTKSSTHQCRSAL